METAIVLFTRDLRLHDNPALHLACGRARQVVPLFVVDPAICGPPNRIAFLAQSLAELRDNLRQIGGDLVIRDGDPAAEVVKLAAEVNADAVYVADDVSHYATRRRQRLERDCARHRLDLHVTAGLTVVPPADLKPASGGPGRRDGRAAAVCPLAAGPAPWQLGDADRKRLGYPDPIVELS